MNNHLKQFLNGILILVWMIVYWAVLSFSASIFSEFNEEFHTQIFYTQIILSFYFHIFLVRYFYSKNKERSALLFFLLCFPFIIAYLLMQFAQVNIPRLLDLIVLIVDCFLIYYVVNSTKSIFFKNSILLLFCISIGVIYPIAYNNIWYYVNKNELKERRDLGEFNFKITDRSGVSFHLEDLKGQTVCIDMWSSSCGNCISSMPEFEALNKEFKKKKEFKIISLYCPIKKEQTYEWFKEYIDRKFDYDIDYYYIDYESFNNLNIRKFPEFLILNKNNNLVYRGQISYLPYVNDNIYNKLKSINENY